jgi:hypothetical protein
MKTLIVTVAIGLSLISLPAFAGGKSGIGVNLGVTSGKGGILGSLLGGSGHGSSGLNVYANVVTGKGGVLGLLLGGSRDTGGCGC